MYSGNNNYGTVAHNEGYVKTGEDGMKSKEKKVFVDPVTGDKTTQVIKTKVERADSASSSSSSGHEGVKKTKHTFSDKTKNTPAGIEHTVKEKHREGGVMQNIKNKIHNALHKWFGWITSFLTIFQIRANVGLIFRTPYYENC